jgi:hypothetical protein
MTRARSDCEYAVAHRKAFLSSTSSIISLTTVGPDIARHRHDFFLPVVSDCDTLEPGDIAFTAIQKTSHQQQEDRPDPALENLPYPFNYPPILVKP